MACAESFEPATIKAQPDDVLLSWVMKTRPQETKNISCNKARQGILCQNSGAILHWLKEGKGHLVQRVSAWKHTTCMMNHNYTWLPTMELRYDYHLHEGQSHNP